MNIQDAESFGRPSPAISPDSALGPFRWPVFRWIWMASVGSAFGALMQMIASAWLMTELTQSHQLVALVQAAVTMPMLVFGVIFGVIADNHNRRKVMLVAHILMVVMAATLAVLASLEAVRPWTLLLITALLGTGFALNAPAWQASVRMMVPRADVPQAISLNAIAFNLARTMGPALGGLLLSIRGPTFVFTLNALCYSIMIVALLRWRPRVAVRERKYRLFASIAEAWRYCIGNSPLRRVLARGFAFGLGSCAFQALIPVVTREHLGGDEVRFGMLMGAFGIGSIVTAVWISRVRLRFGPEAIVTGGMTATAASVFALSFAPSVEVALVMSFFAGAGQVATMTSLNVSMQMRLPDEILGRCLSIFQALVFGGIAIGSWLWGALSDDLGLAAALWSSALLLMVSLIVLRIIAPMPRIGEGHDLP